MTILERAVMPDGTSIQLEDWHEDYPEVFPFADTVAAYPIAKETVERSPFSPQRGETFRAEFRFSNADNAREAFDALVSGAKPLKDFAERLWYRAYAAAL